MTGTKRPRNEQEALEAGYNMAVWRAVELLGGVGKAAYQVGKAESQISRYRSGVCLTPDHVAKAIQKATEGKVTVEDVRRSNRRIEVARLLDRADQLLREAA